jgi:hypothetical protein
MTTNTSIPRAAITADRRARVSAIDQGFSRDDGAVTDFCALAPPLLNVR